VPVSWARRERQAWAVRELNDDESKTRTEA